MNSGMIGVLAVTSIRCSRAFPGTRGDLRSSQQPGAEAELKFPRPVHSPTCRNGVRYLMGYSLETSNLPNFFALHSRDRRRR